MAGRKPDFRLVVPSDNGRGNTTYFRIGGGWKNESKDDGPESVGIQVNVGVPLVLQPGQKLVLFPNTEKEEEES